MSELIAEYPDMIADILDQCGIDRDYLLDEIYSVYGDY